jgi:hypothetical protein
MKILLTKLIICDVIENAYANALSMHCSILLYFLNSL